MGAVGDTGTDATAAAEPSFSERAAEESPVYRDLLLRKKGKKHGPPRTVEPIVLEAPVADTHAHLDMLDDPAVAMARAGAMGVTLICSMTDPTSDAADTYERMDGWLAQAAIERTAIGAPDDAPLPRVRMACGVHPHESKQWDDGLRDELLRLLADPRTAVLGEIGLDYHYDLSPRDIQREVFARQVELAHTTGLPISLHMREAHADGLAILREVGFPKAGTILHCFNLGPDDLEPWLEEDCFISIGGPVTFGSCDDLRRAVPMIPDERLLSETDAPFMTPAPMRGLPCEPAHTLFTAAKLAEVRGIAPGDDRRAFLARLYANAEALICREATPWQRAD